MRAGTLAFAVLFSLQQPVHAAAAAVGLGLPPAHVPSAGMVGSPGTAPVPAMAPVSVPEVVGGPVETPQPLPRSFLWLHSRDFQEEFKGSLKAADGSLDAAALDRISSLMRCKGTGETFPISAGLLELLAEIQRHFEGARIEVLCGYRSPKRNASLRKRRRGVAKESFHIEGMAADIRIPGVPVRKLRDFARSLRAGGVGLYSRRGFIHVDVGPVRSW